ncbi:MAG TPA: hypothetical protein PKY77_15105 [Phycisphaerae bacterium]|nr:hypothetical protein [Phycisphaerae bacterium]HRY70429.1 hypothetical protein [Phycisphaerae bacterium]HSA27663.1 hypothetical protein [Phycisphaerae bacterium]
MHGMTIARSVAMIAAVGLVSAGFALAQASRQPKSRSRVAPKPIPVAPTGGLLRLTFSKSSPLNTLNTLLDRLDIKDPDSLASRKIGDQDLGFGSDRSKWIPDISKESFTVFVPPHDDPNVPYGLFIWLGVGDVQANWQDVFVRHKLIAVATGGTLGTHRTKDFGVYTLPIDAVFNLKQRYPINEQRIYACGFSAGGCLAIRLVKVYPEVFSGGLFLMGGAFTGMTHHGNENGPWEATALAEYPLWRGDYERRRRDVKLVIMKGGADREWRPQEGRSDADALILDGFERVSYLEVPGWSHQPPNRLWFEKGVAALETPPRKPPATAPTTDPRPGPAQVAQAHRWLVSAQKELESVARMQPELRRQLEQQKRYDAFVQHAREKARQYLERTIGDYPTTPAARQAKKMLNDLGDPNGGRE